VADNRLIIAYVEGLAKWKFPSGQNNCDLMLILATWSCLHMYAC